MLFIKVSSFAKVPWRFQFYFNEIKSILSLIRVKFQQIFCGCFGKTRVG